MPDRLNELLRQRALIQDHLSWLDRQIISESDGISPLASPTTVSGQSEGGKQPLVSTPLPFAPAGLPDPAQSNHEADAILADYKKDPRRQQSDIKRGCFLYFLGALAFVSLVVFLFYFFYSRRHALEREHQPLGSPAGLESH
jgi:hypothetical protein